MTLTRLILSNACVLGLGFSLLSLAVGQELQPLHPTDSLRAHSSDTFAPPSQFDETSPSPHLPDQRAPYKFSGRFHLQAGTNQGYLVLQCELPSGSYIYSLTQGGNQNPSKIEVTSSTDFVIYGPFNPDQPPIVIEKDPLFMQRMEKHKEKVQFFVPIEIRAGVDLDHLQPEMIFEGQVCSDEGICMPLFDKKVRAKFAGYFERSAEQQDNSQNRVNQ